MSRIREKPLVESNEEKNFVSLTKLDGVLVSPRAWGREAVLIATSRRAMQSALVAFRKIRAYSLFSWALPAGCNHCGGRQGQNKAQAHLSVYCGLRLDTHRLSVNIWSQEWLKQVIRSGTSAGGPARASLHPGEGLKHTSPPRATAAGRPEVKTGQETEREICTAASHIISTAWIKSLPLQALRNVLKPLSLSLASVPFF